MSIKGLFDKIKEERALVSKDYMDLLGEEENVLEFEDIEVYGRLGGLLNAYDNVIDLIGHEINKEINLSGFFDCNGDIKCIAKYQGKEYTICFREGRLVPELEIYDNGYSILKADSHFTEFAEILYEINQPQIKQEISGNRKSLSDIYELIDTNKCVNELGNGDFGEKPLAELLEFNFDCEMVHSLYFFIKGKKYSKIALVCGSGLEVHFYDEQDAVSIFRWNGKEYVSTGYFLESHEHIEFFNNSFKSNMELIHSIFENDAKPESDETDDLPF